MDNHLFIRRILLVIALLGLTSSLPVQAVSLYKWVDENGRVHYSQTPPDTKARESEQMQVKDSNPYQPTQENEAAGNEEKNNAEPRTTDEAAKIVETRKQNCEIAKQNLTTYQNSDRVKQEDGTVIKLSEEMRAAKIKEAQALVNAYCN